MKNKSHFVIWAIFLFFASQNTTCAQQPPVQAQEINRQALHLDQVTLSGVTLYDQKALLNYAIQQIEKKKDVVDLQNLSDAIRNIYREDGYFLATIVSVLSEQSAQINVSEGEISKIEVAGVDAAIAAKIAAVISSAVGSGPAQLSRFERGVMLAKDLSGVNLHAEFIHTEQGKDILRVAATSVNQRGSISLDNLPRNFGKGAYAVLNEEVYSTVTPGDMFRLNVLPSADFNNQWSGVFGSLTYRTPLNDKGLYGELSIGTGLTRNFYTGPDQNPNNTFQKTNLATGLIGYPIIRDVHTFFYTLSQVDYFAVGGSNTGVNSTDTTVARQSFVYDYSTDVGQKLHLSATLSGGTSGSQYFLSNPSYLLSDANFYHLRVGAGFTAPLDKFSGGLGLRLEASGQYTTNSLPSVEKYFLGDRTRLRGYGYAEVIGDVGYAATAEVSQFIHLGYRYMDSVSPFVFFDVGSVLQNRVVPGSLATQANLASFGIGIQTSSKERFSTRIWYGVPLVSIPNGTQAYSPAIWLQLTQSW
jgi:hemolysin activation/secretion protein